jgi:hypothetical protein
VGLESAAVSGAVAKRESAGDRVKVELDLSDLEELVLADVRRAGGFMSDRAAFRCALERLALFMGLDVPPEAFLEPYRPEMRALLEAERNRRDDHQPGLFSDEACDAGENARRSA